VERGSKDIEEGLVGHFCPELSLTDLPLSDCTDASPSGWRFFGGSTASEKE